MKGTLLLLFFKKNCVTNNFVTVIKKIIHSSKANESMVAILKKRKKIGTDYFTFVFSQSKSEPKLFHNYAKLSELLSLIRSFRRSKKGHTQ